MPPTCSSCGSSSATGAQGRLPRPARAAPAAVAGRRPCAAARSWAMVASTGAGVRASISCSTRDDAIAVETAGIPRSRSSERRARSRGPRRRRSATPPRKRSNHLSGVRSTPLRSAAPIDRADGGAQDEQPDADAEHDGTPPDRATAATAHEREKPERGDTAERRARGSCPGSRAGRAAARSAARPGGSRRITTSTTTIGHPLSLR